MRRANLTRDAFESLLILLDDGETLAQPLFGQVLKFARNLIRPIRLICGEQKKLNLIAIDSRLAQHQIAADPLPDRIEGSPRDTPDMLAPRRIVDEKRLDRREKQPLRIADTRQLAALAPRRSAQLLQNGRCPGRRFPAQQSALELGSQQRARLRLQLE